MNLEKLVQADTPSIQPFSIQTDLYTVPTSIDVTNTIKKNAIEITLWAHKCRVISIDDLIESKKAMGRDKDIQIVKELEKSKEK